MQVDQGHLVASLPQGRLNVKGVPQIGSRVYAIAATYAISPQESNTPPNVPAKYSIVEIAFIPSYSILTSAPRRIKTESQSKEYAQGLTCPVRSCFSFSPFLQPQSNRFIMDGSGPWDKITCRIEDLLSREKAAMVSALFIQTSSVFHTSGQIYKTGCPYAFHINCLSDTRWL